MPSDKKMTLLINEQSAKETPLGVDESPRNRCSVHDLESIVIEDVPISRPTEEHCTIDKVPEILRQNKANGNCFTPSLIALGPYHHGKQELTWKRGEELKIQLVREFYKDKPSSSFVPDYKKVEAVASEARKCYLEDSTKVIEDADFANMMFLDGCALLQFISSDVNGKWGQMNIKDHEKAHIVRDLFLLENQLPFVVLKELMCKNEVENMFGLFVHKIRPVSKVEASWPAKIADIFYNCRKGIAQTSNNSSQNKPNEEDQEPLHLLDSLWKYYIQKSEYRFPIPDHTSKNTDTTREWYTFRSAKEINAAGIRFSHSKTPRFTDVNYKPLPFLHISYLCLPPIIVDDSTKSLLLNLASYEMSSSPSNIYPVSSYICLMDSLIDHGEDVAELRRSGIILNRLRSDHLVVSLFKDVAKDLMSDRNAFRNVKRHIEKHYRNKIKIKITEWLFFNFRILSFIPAILALGMTIVQTYIGVHEYAKQGKK